MENDFNEEGECVAKRYDAVIVGGGHNGLVAACYLAEAGISTLVLERYSKIGGAAISEETVPGFTFSTGSYVLSLMPRKLIEGIMQEIEEKKKKLAEIRSLHRPVTK